MNYDNYSEQLGQIFSETGTIDVLSIPVGATLTIKRTKFDHFDASLTPDPSQISVNLKVDLTK